MIFPREFDRVSAKASEFEDILRELENVVDGRASARIKDILLKV